MSESAWPSRAALPPLYRPEVMIGAASPLWGYFTGAAIAGVAYWWTSRWMQQGFGAWAKAAEPAMGAMTEAAREIEAYAEAAVEPALEAAAEVVGGPVAEALVSDQIPAFPVGGEAAPFGAAVLEAELIADPSLAAELAQEETAAEPPTPAPRTRKPRGEGEAKPH